MTKRGWELGVLKAWIRTLKSASFKCSCGKSSDTGTRLVVWKSGPDLSVLCPSCVAVKKDNGATFGPLVLPNRPPKTGRIKVVPIGAVKPKGPYSIGKCLRCGVNFGYRSDLKSKPKFCSSAHRFKFHSVRRQEVKKSSEGTRADK